MAKQIIGSLKRFNHAIMLLSFSSLKKTEAFLHFYTLSKKQISDTIIKEFLVQTIDLN